MKVVQWTIGLVIGGMILTALFVGVAQGQFDVALGMQEMIKAIITAYQEYKSIQFEKAYIAARK